jgi:hypothetical protein
MIAQPLAAVNSPGPESSWDAAVDAIVRAYSTPPKNFSGGASRKDNILRRNVTNGAFSPTFATQ